VTTAEFFEQLEAPIAPYDMLRHPFYQAWAAGQLTRDDLRGYAQDYYRQVEAAADVYHSNVWRQQLEKRIAANPAAAPAALDAAENAARMLWKALDGIDARRAVAVA